MIFMFIGEMDRFSNRVYVLYSGIHYDALALSPSADAPEEFDTTVFSSEDFSVLSQAHNIADLARKKHGYTDLAKFTLVCDICMKSIRGELEAQDHAHQTGHATFSEYQ